MAPPSRFAGATRWLQRHGVRILPWRSSLRAELAAFGGRQPNAGFAGALPGIFLRVDLPLIGAHFGLDEYVLYTDCDVMFLQDVVDLLEPVRCRYFAAASESDRSNPIDMNSGIMWMHLPGLAEQHEAFRQYILEHLDELPGISWDQGAYSRFYRSEAGAPLWEHLPPELNWKPYWEQSSAARIMHFHGPKPFQQPYIESHFPELGHLTGECFDQLCTTWREYLARAEEPSVSPRRENRVST